MATREKRVAIMVTTLPAGDHLREQNGQKSTTMATRGCHENGLPCRVAIKKAASTLYGDRLFFALRIYQGRLRGWLFCVKIRAKGDYVRRGQLPDRCTPKPVGCSMVRLSST